MTNTDIVRAARQAFRDQDRETAIRLLADDYVFTSPPDEHIGKTAFLERCFPTAARSPAHNAAVPGSAVFAHQLRQRPGPRFRPAAVS